MNSTAVKSLNSEKKREKKKVEQSRKISIEHKEEKEEQEKQRELISTRKHRNIQMSLGP